MDDGTAFFQKNQADCRVVAGSGDSSYFEQEAAYLGHFAKSLSELLRAGDVIVSMIDDGDQIVAVGYPEGRERGGGWLRGIIGDSGLGLQEALTELEWEDL